MKNIASRIAVLLVGCCLIVGCTTTDPNTGEPVYDPVKTEQSKAIIEQTIAGAIASIEMSDDVQRYLNYSANTLCELKDREAIAPSVLAKNLSDALDAEGVIGDTYAIAAKNVIVALYQINYAERGNADLDPEKFMWHILDSMCTAIRQGLRDKGFPVDTTYKVPEIKESSQLALNS